MKVYYKSGIMQKLTLSNEADPLASSIEFAEIYESKLFGVATIFVLTYSNNEDAEAQT